MPDPPHGEAAGAPRGGDRARSREAAEKPERSSDPDDRDRRSDRRRTLSRLGEGHSVRGAVNFVVLTAALSSCNSGIFSTGRMLYTLGGAGQALRTLSEVSKRHIPAHAITLSAVVMLVGVVINYLVPAKAFIYITSTATVGAMWTWGVIVVSHLVYRRRVAAGEVAASPFRMPGSPVTNWIVVAFLAFVGVLLAFNASQRVALYAGAAWAVMIVAAYAIQRRHQSPGLG